MKDAIFRVFAGTLGSYKSYHGVVEILETLEAGGVVMTNIPLKWDRLCMYFEDEKGLILDGKQYVTIQPEQASSFVEYLVKGERDKPNKLVIDEAGLHHNTMDKRQMDRKVLEMIVHARKLHIDTVFIAHHFTEVLAQIRNKAQSVLWFRDLQKIKWLGISCPIPAYIYAEVDARNPKIKYDKAFRFKKKLIYTFYVSHDVQSEAIKAIKEKPEIELKKVERPQKARPAINFIKRWVKRIAFAGVIAGTTAILTASESSESPEDAAQTAMPGPAKQKEKSKQIEPAVIKPEPTFYYSMGFAGVVTSRFSKSPIPTRQDFCRYSHMSVILHDGRTISHLDPRVMIRAEDRAVMFDGKIYYHAPKPKPIEDERQETFNFLR